MKKNLLFAAMALPLVMAGCSSEDALEEFQSNDQFAGIEKVDVTMNMDNANTRLANQWGLEDGDVLGFAWMGTEAAGTKPAPAGSIVIDGNAWQNHPLYANANGTLKPKTSIYVGKYFTYAPYDYSTKGIGKIKFDLENQKLMARGAANEGLNALAKKSIWISPKWTEVTLAGNTDKKGNVTDDAGVDKVFKVYPRKFSNIVQLDLKYKNNNLDGVAQPNMRKVEIIYGNPNMSENVTGFTYAPTAENAADAGKAEYWAAKTMSDMTAAGLTPTLNKAFTLTDVVKAEGEGNVFVYNSLPANATVDHTTNVTIKITNTYGVLTITKQMDQIAKTFDQTLNEGKGGYHKDFDGLTVGSKVDALIAAKSFLNVFNTNGKLEAEADFKESVMDGLEIANDEELQNALKFFKLYKKGTAQNEAKKGTDVKLKLLPESKTSSVFKISKESIALLQEINADAASNTERFITVQAAPTCANIRVMGGGEVPEFYNCFEAPTNLRLNGDDAWTWSKKTDKLGNVVYKNMEDLQGMTLLVKGNFTVSGDIAADGTTDFTLANEGNMEFTTEIHVKENLTNKAGGTITINAGAAMFADKANSNATITNDRTALDKFGKIVNNGNIGVVASSSAVINNYGVIENNAGARTFITTNEDGGNFDAAFAPSNKFGEIILSDKFDNISVSNAAANGFVKYAWNPTTDGKYVTPQPETNVKYNTLVIKDNIEFTTADEDEVKFLEVAAGAKVVITTSDATKTFTLAGGLILNDKAEVDIKLNNKLVCTKAAYITKGRIYLGGEFEHTSYVTYLGGTSADAANVIKY